MSIFLQVTMIMLGMLFDIFLYISTYISLVLFSPGSAKRDIGCGGILHRHLMASCGRNICIENY